MDKDINLKISKNIAKARKKRGLSQKQVAERIGITQNAVYQWENGLRCAKLETVIKVSEAIGCNPNEILNGIKIDTNSSYTAKDVFLEIEKRLEKSRKAEKEAAECGMYQKASEAHGVYFELLDILEYFGQEL